jgi:hypothetical protein
MAATHGISFQAPLPFISSQSIAKEFASFTILSWSSESRQRPHDRTSCCEISLHTPSLSLFCLLISLPLSSSSASEKSSYKFFDFDFLNSAQKRMKAHRANGKIIFDFFDFYLRPSIGAAEAHAALPFSTPPTYVSSTSTVPRSESRPGRTIARRNLCSQVQAVS